MSDDFKRLNELAGLHLPWHMDQRDYRNALNSPYEYDQHPNVNPDGEAFYLKLSHKANWYLNDVAKNIDLYCLGQVVGYGVEGEEEDIDDIMANLTVGEDVGPTYHIYLSPAYAVEEAIDQIANLFGGSVGVTILTAEEYEEETSE